MIPETIISWLVEHPDAALSDTDSQTSFCDSDSESLSDQNDAASYTIIKEVRYGRCHTNNAAFNAFFQGLENLESYVTYMQRPDFLSNDEYAMYVRDNVEVGMLVRCCKNYEEVYVGDIGRVIKIDREGLHDLNLQVININKQ